MVAVGVLASGAARGDDVGGAGEIDLRSRVVILPMVVNASGEHVYLRTGLSDMLASRLGRHGSVAVLRVEDAGQATTDPARAAQLGHELGAQFVVFGSFTQFGQGASLDLQCVEASASEKDERPTARRVFIQSGTVGEIIPKLDETAQKIGLFVTGPGAALAANAAPGAADTPPVSSAPAVPAPTPTPVASVPLDASSEARDLQGLHRRLDAIERYLFGGVEAGDGVADTEIPGENGGEFGLP